MEPRDDELYEAFFKADPQKLIWHENFRENTRQWKIAYDPYKTIQMLQIYGRDPPLSFKIRLQKFEEMQFVLDRYSQIATVLRQCSLDDVKRNFRGSRRDYLAWKNGKIYDQDQLDLQEIDDEFLPGNPLYHEKPVFLQQEGLAEKPEYHSLCGKHEFNEQVARLQEIKQEVESYDLQLSCQIDSLDDYKMDVEFARQMAESKKIEPDVMDWNLMFRFFFNEFLIILVSMVHNLDDADLLDDIP